MADDDNNRPTERDAKTEHLGKSSSAALPGKIGHYRIVRVIGGGGMGTVYEAEQEAPNRIVALKVIRAGVASPNLLRRFEHEAQILGKLDHPGIATIYEAGTFDAGEGPLAPPLPRANATFIFAMF